MNELSYKNELYHYGVIGMRWGKRGGITRIAIGGFPQSKAKKEAKQKKLEAKFKKTNEKRTAKGKKALSTSQFTARQRAIKAAKVVAYKYAIDTVLLGGGGRSTKQMFGDLGITAASAGVSAASTYGISRGVDAGFDAWDNRKKKKK